MANYTPHKPAQVDDYEARRAKFYNAFKAIAGDDNEIDVWELQGLLNDVMRRELEMGSDFSLEACRSMIAMSDNDRSGKLGFEEFLELWRIVMGWKNVFRRFDSDGSGTFSGLELHRALSAVGYRLDRDAYRALMMRYANKDKHITLDSFLACATKLRHTFHTFAKYRGDDNNAVFSKDEFLQNVVYS